MKKLISVLLAVLMIFSVVTLAFAAEDETPEPPATENTQKSPEDQIKELLLGDGSLEDMPLATAKALFKIAKIVLKLAKAYIKVGTKLGFVNGEEVVNDIAKFFAGLIVDTGDTNQLVPATP